MYNVEPQFLEWYGPMKIGAFMKRKRFYHININRGTLRNVGDMKKGL